MAAHLAGHEGNIIDWEGGKIGQRKPAQIFGHVHIGENLVGKRNLLGCPPCSLACSIYRVARVGQRKKTNGKKPTETNGQGGPPSPSVMWGPRRGWAVRVPQQETHHNINLKCPTLDF